MKNFGRKINTCLFEPRKIGLFLGEKFIKVIFQLILLSTVAILPFTVNLLFHDEISSSSRGEINEQLIVKTQQTDMVISDGVLSGSGYKVIYLDEFIVVLNPDDKKLEGFEFDTYIMDFGRDEVRIYLANICISEMKYIEFSNLNIDFSKIAEKDYIESDMFIKFINKNFSKFRSSWVISKSIIKLAEVLFSVLINAFIITLLSKAANPFLRNKYRFKVSLDAQIIFLVSILLDCLFATDYIHIIGTILSMIYLFRALKSIVPIPIKRNIDNRNEGE